MIVCPNCNHQNPDGAVQCEACYTPLPTMINCPNCRAAVQSDASFCGQCGFNLRAAAAEGPDISTPTVAPDFAIPDLPVIEPLVPPDPLPMTPPIAAAPHASATAGSSPVSEPVVASMSELPAPPPPVVPSVSPPHSLAPRILGGYYGNMLSFELDGGR
ncbi:MAG: zinc ribbon domain-containing protein, partial [Cyanobacteriota bacterium]